MASTTADNGQLVVLGATGNQGGPVLKYFAKNNCRFGFKLRGITRNAGSPSSKQLSKLGIEMVEADLNDASSLEKAFSGATHIFGNTDSNQMIWKAIEQPQILGPGQTPGSYGKEIELVQGRNLVRAAASIPTLQRFVWSTLPGVEKWSKGKYTKVPMFDAKEEIAAMLREEPRLAGKLSMLIVGFYANNALSVPQIYAPQKCLDGTYELRIPMSSDVTVPFADLEADMGPWVDALFQASPGVTLVGETETLSWAQWLEKWAKRNGVVAGHRPATKEEFASKIFGMGEAVMEEMSFIEEFGFTGGDREAVLPDALRDRGIEIKQSSMDEHIARTDWSSLL